MTSIMQQQLSTSITSVNLPQHIVQPIRILELQDAHSCTPPPPQNRSYFNPTTNETLYLPAVEVTVHEIGILFDYEIQHAKGVSWCGDKCEEVGEESGFLDKAGDFFGNLFGGDDEDEDIEQVDSEVDAAEAANGSLLELEKYMDNQLWTNILNEDGMTYDDDDECHGLVIDLRRQERRELQNSDETRLLGMTYQPFDYVNPNGCTIPDDTCTSIRGQVSTAYTGDNEYGVIKAVIEQLKKGMESGEFIPPDGEATSLAFLGSRGTGAAGAGDISILSMTGNLDSNEEEESYLSKYGILFVCFVAILGTGCIAATYVKHKRKKRRAKELEEGEMAEEEYAANLALQEDDVAGTKTAEFGEDSSITESPQDNDPQSVINQVRLEEPVELNRTSSEASIEMNLTGTKSWNDVVVDL